MTRAQTNVSDGLWKKFHLNSIAKSFVMKIAESMLTLPWRSASISAKNPLAASGRYKGDTWFCIQCSQNRIQSKIATKLKSVILS